MCLVVELIGGKRKDSRLHFDEWNQAWMLMDGRLHRVPLTCLSMLYIGRLVT
jgi:hypothetical protein